MSPACQHGEQGFSISIQYLGMELLVECYAPGEPVPQGSMSVGRNGQLYYSNAKRLKPWRETVADSVRAFMPRNHEAVDSAIMVEVDFYFKRGKTVLRPEKITAPDLDKCVRAVGDALTSTNIYTDDSRVVEWRARKHYATDEQKEGAVIRVWKI